MGGTAVPKRGEWGADKMGMDEISISLIALPAVRYESNCTVDSVNSSMKSATKFSPNYALLLLNLNDNDE